MTADDDLIRTANGIVLRQDELSIAAIRAQGPGGQNVNKTSSAIQLQFDIPASEGLSDSQKQRLLAARDSRLSADGVLTIKAQRHRSQDKNRKDAVNRLVEFIEAGLRTVKPRKKTRPGKAAVERRLREKAARSRLKSARRSPRDE